MGMYEHDEVDTAPDIVVLGGEYYRDGAPVDDDNMPVASDCYASARFKSGLPVELQADICGNPIIG